MRVLQTRFFFSHYILLYSCSLYARAYRKPVWKSVWKMADCRCTVGSIYGSEKFFFFSIHIILIIWTRQTHRKYTKILTMTSKWRATTWPIMTITWFKFFSTVCHFPFFFFLYLFLFHVFVFHTFFLCSLLLR